MTSAIKSNPSHFHDSTVAAPSIAFLVSAFLAKLLAVEARESIDVVTSGDKSDAAWTWGM